MKTLVIFTLIAAATFLAGCSGEPSVEDGGKAFAKKDYTTAFNIYLDHAKKGDLDSQSIVGGMYAMGKGISKDEKEAHYWLEKAAEAGHAHAQLGYGSLYLTSDSSLYYDPDKSIKWLTKSADQGNETAQFILMNAYAAGSDVRRNEEEAFFWAMIIYRTCPDLKLANAAGNLIDINGNYYGSKLTSDGHHRVLKRVENWLRKTRSTIIRNVQDG